MFFSQFLGLMSTSAI